MKPPSLLAAEARAAEARQRLMGTVGEIQERLQPRNVLNEVGETVSTTGRRALATTVDTAKRKPLIAIGAATLAVAILGRHRLYRLFAADKTPTGHAKD